MSTKYYQRSTATDEESNVPLFTQEGDFNPEEWQDKKIRHGFLKKVFSIVSLQLLFTFGVTWLCRDDSVKTFVQDPNNNYLVLFAYVGLISVMIALVCCDRVARTYPTNYFVLALLTFFESYLLGILTSYYDTDIVFWAEIITISVTIALTIYAIQTKYDFTTMGSMLLGGLVVLIIFGLINIFVQNQITNMIYSSLGALVFSFYLIYDVQLIAGGSHRKYQLAPTDYIFAAVCIYLDIINLFIFILQLLNGGRRN
ncbi:Inhibitor of apoptosis-promoting Bax1 [seawater metagenome]|uniref:Inhibitor of apoptosis-promoting Bax1 n=1 Tax=seawater metagenome TaxID=1561972 RepID=A0A5E8CK30_9ZZZZ